MNNNTTSCVKFSDQKICPYCKEPKAIKNGTTKNKKQQYHCKACNKRYISNYSYNAYRLNINADIVLFTKEGLGIRSTARILKIATTTLLKRIRAIAKQISPPVIKKGKEYEVDEMCSYVRRKTNFIWLVYALEKESKEVVSFNVGKRTNKTLRRVIDTLKLSDAKKIFTDGLKNYKYLIESNVHAVKHHATNHIERKNLTIRTHLKRFSRRTICFSRSDVMLDAILRIYFWA